MKLSSILLSIKKCTEPVTKSMFPLKARTKVFEPRQKIKKKKKKYTKHTFKIQGIIFLLRGDILRQSYCYCLNSVAILLLLLELFSFSVVQLLWKACNPPGNHRRGMLKARKTSLNSKFRASLLNRSTSLNLTSFKQKD